MKLMLRLLSLAAMVYVGLAAFLFVKQRKLIYFPTRLTAEELAARAAEQQCRPWTNASGDRIGWWRPAEGKAVGTVLITHGNASTAVGREYIAQPLQSARPLDVFVLEYPGFADRPGEPTEASLLGAATEGFVLLTNRPGPLLLVGESLGTGVAAFLAGQCPGRVAGVCLLAPYTRLSDVGAAQFPWLPVRLLLRDRYPSAEHLRSFHGPLAVLVGEADSTVPAELGRRLHAGYDGPKRLWNFPGQEHWEVIEQPANVWLEVLRFLLPE
jgi:pimeloyl-ACP methyl ester carboxylesterase